MGYFCIFVFFFGAQQPLVSCHGMRHISQQSYLINDSINNFMAFTKTTVNMYYIRSHCTSYHNHHGLDQNLTEINTSITSGFGEGALSCFLVSFT